MKIMCLRLILWLILSCIICNTYAEITLGPWATLTSNTILARGQAVQAGNTIYLVGGYSGLSTPHPVEKATILPSNDLTTWSILSSSEFNIARDNGVAFSANGYIYYLGGANFYVVPSTGERAKINPDTSLGPWMNYGTSSFLIYACSAITTHGYLYLVGGYNANPNIYRCFLNSDGSLGPWLLCTSALNIGREYAGVLVYNNFLFVSEGWTADTTVPTVERAMIYPDGELGPFTIISYPIAGHFNAPLLKIGNYLYILDGYSGGDYSYRVEKSYLNSFLDLGTWEPGPYLNQQRTAPYAQTSTAVYMISGGSFEGTSLTSCERSLILNDTSVESDKWQFFK